MNQKESYLEVLCKDNDIDLDAMVRDVKRYISNFNERKFREAFAFAAKAHEGQFRKENKPYIVHPVETVRILISMHADEDTLVAAFMHDVPEDTEYTIDQIETRFGKKVAFLVEGITKLSKVHFRNEMVERQIESLKKLFIHSAEDPRIILIKLADRLHNMRTLQYHEKQEKQVRIARETLEIFVPIASLLGIEELKAELEDLCFRYLHRDEYESLADRMRRNKEKNQIVLEETIQFVQKKLDEAHLKAMVYGRQKNLYSIYKKIVAQGKRLDEIDDLVAMRILTSEREDCYQVLGLIHQLFKPKMSKFKDYIAVPKVNGYQSLHTTVFGLKGLVTEFQIRTHQMHLEAEYGIASHYFYDEQKNKVQQLEKDHRAYWAEKILGMQKEQLASNEFIEDLKLDIFQDRIFVFTPIGDPIDLPKGATCVDFAYNIHTQVGHRALKADVNGEIVPMTTVLRTGDTVRIIVSDRQQAPNREWLSFVKTNVAKNRIRDYLKHESRGAKIKAGQHLLQKEFDRAGLGLVKSISQRKIRQFCKRFSHLGCRTMDDLMVAIGDGSLSTLEVFHGLYPEQEMKTMGFFSLGQFRVLNNHLPNHTDVPAKIISAASPGQLRKYLEVLADMGLQFTKTKAYYSFWTGKFICKLQLHVKNFSQLSQFFEKVEHIEGVEHVERQFFLRKTFFIIYSCFTFLVWAVHPYILYMLTQDSFTAQYRIISPFFLYGSLFLLFLMVFSLKRLTQRSFPELRETKTVWVMTLVFSGFALMTFFAETFFFRLQVNLLVAFALFVLICSYVLLEYVDYRERYLK